MNIPPSIALVLVVCAAVSLIIHCLSIQRLRALLAGQHEWRRLASIRRVEATELAERNIRLIGELKKADRRISEQGIALRAPNKWAIMARACMRNKWAMCDTGEVMGKVGYAIVSPQWESASIISKGSSPQEAFDTAVRVSERAKHQLSS